MAEHPIIVERPIVVSNGKAALGRPPEKVLDVSVAWPARCLAAQAIGGTGGRGIRYCSRRERKIALRGSRPRRGTRGAGC